MMDADNYRHPDTTEKVIRAFYKVYNTPGYGLLEKVYENALCIELRSMGFCVEKQRPVRAFYTERKVGDYADLVGEGSVIIELKAAETLCEERESRLVNYLKATEIEAGLPLNFGREPRLKRKVFSNQQHKQS